MTKTPPDRASGATAPREAETYISIGGLSAATGVSTETLRSWEARYGFPRAARRPSGHRQFEIGIVEHIRRISRALKLGLRAGNVVPLSEPALDALLATMPPNGRRRRVTAILSPEGLLTLIRTHDSDGLRQYFWGNANEDLLAYLEDRIAPALEVVGSAWAKGEIGVAQEHLVSERISDALRNMRARFEESAQGPSVVLATLPGELHGLGLQMASIVLAARRFRVFPLGTEAPIEQVASMATQTRAMAIALSISVFSAPNASMQLKRARTLIPGEIRILAGGAGTPRRMEGVVVLRDLARLDAWAAKTVSSPVSHRSTIP